MILIAYDLNWEINGKSAIGFGYQFSSSNVGFLASEQAEKPEDNFRPIKHKHN